MFPIKPFIVQIPCIVCGEETSHYLRFESYCPKTHKVKFTVQCCECIQSCGDENTPIHEGELDCNVFNQLTPEEDDPVSS